MGIFDWLFGRGRSSDLTPVIASAPQWETSENGHPCIIHKNRRVTVFAADRGWKFCIAKTENDNNPFFSDVYRTEDAAKYEALAHVERRPSQYATFSQDSREARRAKWEAHIAETEDRLSELATAFASIGTLGELRKIERKVDTQLKHGPRHISECYRDGVSDDFIFRAEKTAGEFEVLKIKIDARAADLKKSKGQHKSST